MFRDMLRLGSLFSLVAMAYSYMGYEGYSLLRVYPTSIFQLNALRRLSDEVDYLNEPRSFNKAADILLQVRDLNETQHFLNTYGVPNFVIEDDFGTIVQREKRSVLSNSNVPITRDMIMSHYLSFKMQLRVMNQLAATLPGLVRLEQLGKSHEGRPIVAAFIGFKSNITKPIYWIDAGIHAREWIAPAAAMYALWEYATNPEHYDLLRQIDVVIVPNVNPDGYEYSRLVNRGWRKNRSPTTKPECPGVDGNRNYPFHWGVRGTSHNPCDASYRGEHPASEPEVGALIKAIIARKRRIRGYIALHSFGQLILYPWGHTRRAFPEDVKDLIEMGNEMANAIKSIGGTKYNVKNSGAFYPVAGAADDWAKSIGIKYSFTIELAPISRRVGFKLPEQHISQTVTEMFAGLNVLAKKITEDCKALKGYRPIRLPSSTGTRVILK